MSLNLNIGGGDILGIGELSNSFKEVLTRPFDQGFSFLNTTGNNITSIIKDTESNIIKVFQNGTIAFMDTTEKIENLISQFEKGVFDSVQIGELGIITTVKQTEGDIATIVANSIQNIMNNTRAITRSTFSVIDNQMDKIIDSFDHITNNIFNLIQIIIFLQIVGATIFFYKYGDKTFNLLEILIYKVSDLPLNQLINFSLI